MYNRHKHARHKHADIICAWANGDDIEYRSSVEGGWFLVTSFTPYWDPGMEFRVVPSETDDEKTDVEKTDVEKTDVEKTDVVAEETHGCIYHFEHGIGDTVYCPFGITIKSGKITGVERDTRSHIYTAATVVDTRYSIQGIERSIDECQVYSTKEGAAEHIKQKALRS